MNLRHMEVFRAVMLTGSISGAAEILHVSPPAVSKLLAHAARQSGLVLFERIKGRLVPTPEAQQLYQEVENLWRGVERVRDVTRSLGDPHSGVLRLAVSASLGTYLVPRAVALLYERHERIKVSMEVRIAPIMVEALLDQSAHLGIAMQPIDHPNLSAVRRYACALACVMRSDHRLAAKREIVPRDLAGERVISSPASTPYGQSLRRAYGAAARSAKLDVEVRSAASACWFAQAGAGIAIVDQAAVAGQSFSGLVVRPFRARESLDVRILRNAYRPLSLVHQNFCDAFEQVWNESMAAGRH
ncbi:LysR substrate-binding domain-containing protein [Xenophilus arseniciresistens]|uniref:LysR substrate-binding domain-containing protein n=1 Tax=Xenophilus arseniciresistens TaxID=1283306 RepID=A0AAE3N5K0_9BURK|nr:LysR substrate-binding domain-containing protein [Xenophilus arseniciresistens]MDA7415263.1 LysR substrate-binding domain-containing protein [Xenophilus arseniciresistens]